MKITVSLDELDVAIKAVEEINQKIKNLSKILVDRLAFMGATKASLEFSRAIYNGKNDVSVSVETVNANTVKIVSQGEAVLFIEFGSGITYGYGHEKADAFGMGPGTYPSDKGKWDNPKGWWFTDENGSQHTYGNPPARAMYETEKELRNAVLQVAREVFGNH